MGIRSRAIALALAWATAVTSVALVGVPAVALAQGAPEVTSAELVEHAEEWNGKRVTFTGEAIGSAMRRGDIAWLHLNDDPYATEADAATQRPSGYNAGHAVLVPATLADRVRHFGSYRQRGDLVRVEGTFRAADPENGGDMLIEADVLTVVREGRELDAPVAPWKLWLLLALTVTAGTSYAAMHRQRFGEPRAGRS